MCRSGIRCFPDKTVLDNVTFGLEVTSRGLRGSGAKAFREEATAVSAAHRIEEADAREISAPVIGRHAAAGGDRAGADHEAADAADGRGVQCARSGDAARDAAVDQELWQESGTTVVFVTHNTREAVCLGTRVIALAKGERGASVGARFAGAAFGFRFRGSGSG